MHRELPLWNDSETDLLPQYQATFGHTIIGGSVTVEVISKFLSVKILDCSLYSDAEQVSASQSGDLFSFRVKPEFFLYIRYADFNVIYADASFFLRNENWMKLSAGLKRAVCVGTQQNDLSYFYRIFRSGATGGVQVREGRSLREPQQAEISASYNGEVIFKDKAEESTLDVLIKNWIRATPVPRLGARNLKEFFEPNEMRWLGASVCVFTRK